MACVCRSSDQRKPGDTSETSLFIFCVTEDAGADQKSQRLKLLSMLSKGLLEVNDRNDDFANVWFWDVNCLVHQFNLVVGGHLHLIDASLKALQQEFLYYSALAKIIYTWRNHSQVMMSEYDVDQMASRQLPPAPCAARWGCIHELEIFLLATGVHNVTQNFVSACKKISGKRKNQASGRVSSKSLPLDEIALDELKAYQARMSRYMQSAVSAVTNSVFWFFLHVSFVTKEPLIACFAWLQKHRHMAVISFATSKCHEFSSQLRQLVVDRRWIDWCLDQSGAREALPAECVWDLVSAATDIASHNCTSFERRIVEYITKWLGWACLGTHETVCVSISRILTSLCFVLYLPLSISMVLPLETCKVSVLIVLGFGFGQ